ncbi:MAG: tyrosine-type recombinase/integrase [Phycisphaerales bacterium]
MARLPENGIPSYRLHKSSRRALVSIDGRDHYLGVHGTPESREKYDRLINLWLVNGRRLPDSGVGVGTDDRADVTVVEVVARYWEFAEKRYAGQRATLLNIRRALSILRQLFGPTPVSQFGPKALRTYQRALVELPADRLPNGASKRSGPLARKTVNYHTGVVKRMFRWAKNEEIVPGEVFDALRDVPWLRAGETKARETPKVRPVPDAIVEATLPFLPEVVADMVRVQRFTGMRPAEVCMMTPRDLDTSPPAWKYVPRHHKTEIHGKDRIVLIGPKAQAVLAKYLRSDDWIRPLDAAIFSPREAEDQRRAMKRAARKTKVQPSQQNRRLRFPKFGPGERYDSASYRKAVAWGCDAANPHPTLSTIPRTKRTPEQERELREWKSSHRWGPNRLRHARATEVRREHGLDAAQVVLGHSRVSTSQVYAEANEDKAVRAALATG